MAIKKLSKEGQFELGIEEKFQGKQWAYTVVTGEHAMGLGIACANERGYCPVPLSWAHADTWDEMEAHAKELNTERGVAPDEVNRIVLSSMFHGEKERDPDLLPSNKDRSGRVDQIYELYEKLTDVDDHEGFVSDVLADIMHFCEREGIDFASKVAMAEMHFEAEKEDEENLHGKAPRG